MGTSWYMDFETDTWQVFRTTKKSSLWIWGEWKLLWWWIQPIAMFGTNLWAGKQTTWLLRSWVEMVNTPTSLFLRPFSGFWAGTVIFIWSFIEKVLNLAMLGGNVSESAQGQLKVANFQIDPHCIPFLFDFGIQWMTSCKNLKTTQPSNLQPVGLCQIQAGTNSK